MTMLSSHSDPQMATLLGKASTTEQGIIAYADECCTEPSYMSYRQLQEVASQKAALVRRCGVAFPGSVLIIHFRTQLENIIWFWASVLAGCVPCISTTLVNTQEGRKSQFQHLHRLLLDPVVITKKQLKNSDFADNDVLRVVSIEEIETAKQCAEYTAVPRGPSVLETDSSTALTEGIATLMLTSGSTGDAKAVCLTYRQILSSASGKFEIMPLPPGSAILNWISLDHVASLIEIHLCGMISGLDQVHVPAVNIIRDPLLFLRLITKHKVSRTFAPNSFLQQLSTVLDNQSFDCLHDIDLRCLRFIASGGEPNSVKTCALLTKQLSKLGAVESVITPGFGMTETCAGAIYNRSCFQSDFQSGFEFTSLGTCMPGIQMRISQYKSTYGGERAGHNSAHAQEGDLEVRGDVVFESYFNDPAATQEAFTSDGWFKTGDLASIDDHGNLRLSGRSKELIILNGVNYAPQQVELAIEQANISGVASSSIVCFATRQLGSSTEEVVVIYEHTYDFDDIDTQMEAMGHIARTVMLTIGAHPRILPLPSGRLDKSTLGKVSRAKVRKALQEGKFQDQEEKNNQMIHFFRLAHHIEPRDDTERLIMHVVLDTLNVTEDISIDTCIVAIGITSVDLIRLKVNLQKALDIREISLGTIMTHNTIRSLAAVVKKRSLRVQDGEEYNPLVILQPDGSKTPLWLLHPGIGEVLVFMGLVPYLRDRPIFALRARGFNPGEMPFKNLTEVLATYHHSLKQQQPHGPYAIAGYSYGSMIAFELTKILEANGDSVEFLGSFNLPPHIKDRMRMLDWTAGVLHIAQFCGIISEERSDKLANELRGLSQTEQIARVLSESDPSRCEALALTQESLQTWTNVAWSLQKIGWEYEPSGVVKHMDVFYCQPLKIVSKTREEYRNTKLNQWLHFTRAGVEYHEVDGEHYTMIGPENVARFQRILINAMTARGL